MPIKTETNAAKLQNRLEKTRGEYENILTILQARVSSAKDYEDWCVITKQTEDLLKTARYARNIAGL